MIRSTSCLTENTLSLRDSKSDLTGIRHWLRPAVTGIFGMLSSLLNFNSLTYKMRPLIIYLPKKNVLKISGDKVYNALGTHFQYTEINIIS